MSTNLHRLQKENVPVAERWPDFGRATSAVAARKWEPEAAVLELDAARRNKLKVEKKESI